MSGGYDYEVIEDVKNDLCCVICLNLMKDAMQLGCEHGMCNFCLQSLANSSRQRNVEFVCPSCRIPVDENKVHPAGMVNRLILSVKVKCVNSKAGCNWIGEISNMSDHQNNFCDHQNFPCDHVGCNFHIRRADMTEHKNICDFRIVSCDYCQENCVYRDLPIHLRMCFHYPVLCMNDCGELIPRKEIDEHLQKSCPLRLVDCTFKHVGCIAKMTAENVKKHLSSSLEEHLILVTKDSVDIRCILKQTRNEIDSTITATKEELAATKEELAATKEELATTKEGLLAMIAKESTNIVFSKDIVMSELYKSIVAKLNVDQKKYLNKIADKLVYEKVLKKPLTFELFKIKLCDAYNRTILPYLTNDIASEFVNSYEHLLDKGLSPAFWEAWKCDIKKSILTHASFEQANKFLELQKRVHQLVADSAIWYLAAEPLQKPFLFINGSYYIYVNLTEKNSQVVALPQESIAFTKNAGAQFVSKKYNISVIRGIGDKGTIQEYGINPNFSLYYIGEPRQTHPRNTYFVRANLKK